ncbi:sodium:solute symporter family transporter [Aestuariibacter salexigens]|uniref:sodium:solute symporter family transporter n=1 Tax=Aestuariibacter salexigens TaxID=226010 RepID=UPI0004220A4D|nr:sodium/solute symporter [Aestuariibacter salexigens]
MSALDYVIISIYLLGLLAMGFQFRRNAKQNDYFLGGRTLGWKPLALSVMATQLSAISFVSAPAFVGLREGGGLVWLSYELALPLAMLLLISTILPVLHRSGVVSVYDFLQQRFGLSTRVLLSVVFQISRSFATAIMIYAVSIILQGTMGLAFWHSIMIIGGVTLIYSLQGGMRAVVYGDAAQMLLIVLGALLCLGFGLHLLGGFSSLLEHVQPERLDAVRPAALGFDGQGFGLLPMLFGGIVLYASYYGCDQSEAQRSLSAKSVPELRKMILTASILRFPITLIYCITGLVIGAFALQTPEFMAQIPTDNPDWMMPLFIVNYLPSGVVGLLLVAIFAAAMSSLSSAINSLSAVSTEDLQRLSKRKWLPSQYLHKARLAGCFWGVVTLLLSAFAGNIAPTVIEAINKVGSLFYGPILATFLLAILPKRPSATQMNLGIVAGVVVNLYLWLAVPQVFWFWWNLTGFSVTLLMSLLVSMLRKNANVSDKTPWLDIQPRTAGLLIGWFILILTLLMLSHWL